MKSFRFLLQSCCGLVAVLSALASVTAMAQNAPIAMSDARIQYMGRYDAANPARPHFAYPGSGLRLRFRGTGLKLQVNADSEKSALTVVVDYGEPWLQLLQPGENQLTLASGLEEGEHTLFLYKRTETWQGMIYLEAITLDGNGELLAPPPAPTRKLMFIGDSVTCGTGINDNATCTNPVSDPSSDAYDAYGLRLARRLDAQSHLVCYGGRGVVRDYRGMTAEADHIVNAPQYLDLAIPTDTEATRVPWDAKRYQPDAIVISLGTNDMNLEKTAPLDEAKWVAAYVEFVKKVRREYPHALLLLTNGAIVTDPLLEKMVQETATKVADARVRFVHGVHYPGNGCDGHPTRTQHAHIADDLEPVLRDALGW